MTAHDAAILMRRNGNEISELWRLGKFISECSSNKSDITWDIVWTTFDPFPVFPRSRKEQREHSSKHLSLSPTDETT